MLNRRGSIPLYDNHLPEALHLKKVSVPEPTLSLQSYVADQHADAGLAMGEIILANKSENNQLPEGATKKNIHFAITTSKNRQKGTGRGGN